LQQLRKKKTELEQGRLELQREKEIRAAQAQSPWTHQRFALERK
jgi:heme exporter protein D